ncbi:MAG: CinA family protein [Chromatiales bacterium]|nr:CinA family protein [Chromatiales bacterium]
MPDTLDDKSLYDTISNRLATILRARGMRLATAESCTGGWIAKACTDIPGSSAWFSAGLVTYSNEAKQTVLGIDASLLSEHGAVSYQVVAQMLDHTLGKVTDADIAVAVSGIAGPDGGCAAKPVGTIWLGWQLRGGTPRIRHFNFVGSRSDIRRTTVAHAVQGIVQLLQEG